MNAHEAHAIAEAAEAALNATSTRSFRRFGDHGDVSIPVMEDIIREQVPVISMAGWMSSSVSAKLGYLINRIISTNNITGHRYTLFANSALEAMYAVIRLCRQTSRKTRGAEAYKVLIYDRDGQYSLFFDPLAHGPADALCPAVYVARSESEFADLLQTHRDGLACTIFVRYPGMELSAETEAAIDEVARATGMMRVAAHSELALDDPALFTLQGEPDIVIFGETLANREAPFGAFSVTDAAYAVWGTRQALSTYTSTFAGNTTALSVAFEALRRKTSHVTHIDERVFEIIEGSFDKRIEYFRRYVHPAFADLFASEKKDLNILRASGSTINLANGKEVLDLSGLGCSLRGHNPEDVVEKVLATYNPAIDYLSRVEALVGQLSGFPHLFPSVSGAGAVDNALMLALLARPERKKIILFTGNYSGKTLPSVNASKSAPLLADRDLSAFEPYYEHIHYIDPFEDAAAEKFTTLTRDEDVALVWFEMIQGYMLQELPAELLRLVEENKDRCGYLVGVDEVLTGMWKNGSTLLFQQEHLSRVDVTTMSKATSDMMFPISWTLVTDDVRRCAEQTSQKAVQQLRSFYRNNVGAAIALNGLTTAAEFFRADRRSKKAARFQQDLAEVARSSPLFEGVTLAGNLARLNLNKDWFPYQEGSIQGTLVEGAISKLFLHSAGILLTNLRIFLPAMHDEAIYEAVLRRMRAGAAAVTPQSVYAYMLCQDYEILDALGMTRNFKTILLETARG